MFTTIKSFLRLRKTGSERGSTLIELLVALGLVGIMNLAITKSAVLSAASQGFAENRSIAMQLAMNEIEKFAAIDPTLLMAASGGTTTVTREGKQFTRVTTVTVNADSTRTIHVNVTNVVAHLKGTVDLEETFPLWGSQ
jgi:type II secretory pathway pseudopilin PulG